jgi:hypothetical protein
MRAAACRGCLLGASSLSDFAQAISCSDNAIQVDHRSLASRVKLLDCFAPNDMHR